jgi:hypothetical protein
VLLAIKISFPLISHSVFPEQAMGYDLGEGNTTEKMHHVSEILGEFARIAKAERDTLKIAIPFSCVRYVYTLTLVGLFCAMLKGFVCFFEHHPSADEEEDQSSAQNVDKPIVDDLRRWLKSPANSN